MSHPLPTGSFTVSPEAVEALATELRALAGELVDDAGWVRAAAASFPVALGGDEGWTAGGTATAWARLQEVLAARRRGHRRAPSSRPWTPTWPRTPALAGRPPR